MAHQQQQFLKNLLAEQRSRLVGSLMNYLEKEVYPELDEMSQRALRAKVLGAVAQYHDVCLDLLKASVNDGSVLNEAALEAISALHADVRQALARVE